MISTPRLLSAVFFAVMILRFLTAVGVASVGEAKTQLTNVVEVAPVPAWVESEAYENNPEQPGRGAPATTLLRDEQDRLGADGLDCFYHVAVRLDNAEGVRRHSEWSVVFAPEYEHLTWHALRVIRGDQVSDRLPTAQFKKLQRETQLEEQVYTGLITMATVLEDVQIGDIVEVSYTVRRANPLMRGRLGLEHYLGSPYPLRRQVIICRTPVEMPDLSVSIWSPPGTQNLPQSLFGMASLRSALNKTVTSTEHVYRWEGKKLPAVPFDQNLPGAAYPYGSVIRLSSFQSWGEVADWARDFFTQPGPLPPVAVTMVERWKKESSDPDERVRKALQWVQENLRYFAMAMGDHNLRPRILSEICDTRYGDCKDKSVLLARMLNELGVEAWPALVNTYRCETLKEISPDPFAFNHCIVAYRRNDEIRWLDPTLKHQYPAKNLWAVPPYGLGLILRPDEDALTPIMADPLREPDTVVHDVFVIDQASGDAVLTTEVTLRGLQADFYRQQLEAMTPEDLSKNWFNFTSRFYKQLKEIEPPVPTDDTTANIIVIRAKYQLPEFFHESRGERVFQVYAYMLRAHLDMPESRRRHWPYAIESSRFVRHRIDVDLPFVATIGQQPRVVSLDGLEYHLEQSTVGSHFAAVHDLKLTKPYIAADRMNSFADAAEEIMEAMETTLRDPGRPPVPKLVPLTSLPTGNGHGAPP